MAGREEVVVFRRLFRANCGGTWTPSGGAEFREAMDAVAAFLEGVPDDRKLLILSFMLEVIRNDLKYDQLTKILYRGRNLGPCVWLPFPAVCWDERGNRIEVFRGEAKERMVSLADDCVVILPWHRGRLQLSMETVGAHGFRFDNMNHRAYYFVPLDICWVLNGKHSIAADVGFGNGHMRALEYDVSVLFGHVRTDGRYWYSRHSGDRLGALCDFRVGVLFELARRKHELLGC